MFKMMRACIKIRDPYKLWINADEQEEYATSPLLKHLGRKGKHHKAKKQKPVDRGNENKESKETEGDEKGASLSVTKKKSEGKKLR